MEWYLVKSRGNFIHCLISYHAMKTYLESGVLTSALDGGEWSAWCPDRFTPGERAPSTLWIGGWMGPRVGLDAVARRKNHGPCWESNRGGPLRSLVTVLPELLRLFSNTENGSVWTFTSSQFICVGHRQTKHVLVPCCHISVPGTLAVFSVVRQVGIRSAETLLSIIFDALL
jgi:hypothetical protein